MTKYNKQFFEEVKLNVKELPIDEVIERYGANVKRRGRTINVECVHHPGDMTCASISTKINILKCFKCDKAYDSIAYIMDTEGLDFCETVMDIAVRFGIVSQRDVEENTIQQYANRYANRYNNFNKNTKKSVVKNVASQYKRREYEAINDIASPEILDKVFRTFAKSRSLLNGSRLIASDKKYLLSRMLTENDIAKYGFFSMPPTAIMPMFIKALKKYHNLDENVLSKIPGFYKDTKGNYTFNTVNGIGIPILNERKQVVGIQIRLNELKTNANANKKYNRYFWFSSSSLKDGCTDGTSSGSPVDVVYPNISKDKWVNSIHITEGKFKTIFLSRYTNSICISVQGVGNWTSIPKTISKIEALNKIKIDSVFIDFDGDLAEKIQVCSNAQKMSSTIKKENHINDIFYCTWDDSFGKGIDDLILNNNIDKIKIINKNFFDYNYNLLLKELQSKNTTFEELSTEERKDIFFEKVFEKA